MALVPDSVGYSETVNSVDASTVPTTPDDSLNGGTDKLDEESNGSRTTVTEDSDPEPITNVPRVRSICCVGAGYVGTAKSFSQ
jgi:UDPglucose 6-dehydrogenase